MITSFLARRVILVDILALLFGISSWISINGLWVELPLLVQHLPEGWALPSYLSIIVQVANIGPITYGLLRSCMRTSPSHRVSISLLLGVGCAASLSLILVWDMTSIIDGQMRSTGLFICVFLLSLVDCTSSVLFLPYMAIFRQVYLNSYLIGEGMSGFLPSIAALAQGVSGNPECITLENGTEVMEEITEKARFSTSDFFTFLLTMMILSLLGFVLLEHLPAARKERISDNMSSRSSTAFSDAFSESSSDVDRISQDDSIIEKLGVTQPTKYNIYLLLSIICIVSFLSNGFLPSIQSYSCLPYGNTVYHLSVTLHAMANPLMAFLAFFLPCTRQRVTAGLTMLGSLLAVFILATALYSPDMVSSVEVGGTLVVLTWVVSGAIFSYVKVSVAGMCRDSGWLFYCGVLTQVGSAAGALLAFILVNQVNLFRGYYVTCGGDRI